MREKIYITFLNILKENLFADKDNKIFMKKILKYHYYIIILF